MSLTLKFMEFEYHGKIFEFMALKYHEELDFAKLKYPKSDRSLHISETVVDCNIVCKKCVICLYSPSFKCGTFINGEWGNFMNGESGEILTLKKWFSHVPISFCHMSVFYHISTLLGHERQIIENRLRNETFCKV